MRTSLRLATFLAVVLVARCEGADRQVYDRLMYYGMRDASGAVALDTNLFVVCDDETNVLRIYRRDKGGAPVGEVNLTAFLGTRSGAGEADLEGAARIGNRVFWIGSHGRNRNGKDRPSRRCFFATDLKPGAGPLSVAPVGKPCHQLLEALTNDPRLTRFSLAAGARLAPKLEGALNIEGLSPTPEGHLLIGFRNPIPGGKALLIPLLNPNDVIMGQAAKLGDPIQLDLGGLGVRDIAFYNGTYLILAGSYHRGGKPALYRWLGPGSQPEKLPVKGLKNYNPEAIIIYPDRGLEAIQVLSDDGAEASEEMPGLRTFRSFWVRP